MKAEDLRLALVIEHIRRDGSTEIHKQVGRKNLDLDTQLKPVIEASMKGFMDHVEKKSGQPITYDELIMVLSYVDYMLELSPE